MKLKKRIEKKPVSLKTKLYKQAWALFRRDLITKEEFIQRLERYINV
jgi:hypothetical protein